MSEINLSEEIKKAISEYKNELTESINEIGHETIKQLTNESRRNAPKNTGSYKRHIAWMSKKNKRSGDITYTWYVKGESGRLTHLLVNGHALRDGGRVSGNPFLKNAVNNAVDKYEKDIEKTIKK